MADNLSDGMLRACDYPRLIGEPLAALKNGARAALFAKKGTRITRMAHVAYHDGVILREVEGLMQKISPTGAIITIRVPAVKDGKEEIRPAITVDLPTDYIVAYGFGEHRTKTMRNRLKAAYAGARK